MCAVICKVVNRKLLKDKNVPVMRENILGALTYKVPNKAFVILQHEIKDMQMKFGDKLFMAKTSVYDFNSLFKDHIPGYKDHMNVRITQDYSDNGMRIIHVVLDPKNTEFDILINNKKLYHKYGNEDDSKVAGDIVEIKVPIREFDYKYRKTTNTLSLDYIINYDKIPYSKENLLVEDAPTYLHGFWYVTTNSKLELLAKYTRKEEGKFLREFLNKGGLRNDEFLHMGII